MKRKSITNFLFYIWTVGSVFVIAVVFLSVLRFLFFYGYPVLKASLRSGQAVTPVLEAENLLGMVATTLFLTLLTLGISLPFALGTSIYLSEYKKVPVILFCMQILSGIPSAVYGLFGLLIFVRIAGFGMSMIAGGLTLSLMLLPLLVYEIYAGMNAVSKAHGPASLALGASKWETIFHLLIPKSIPSVMTGTMLVMGRIVAESAALLFTIGSFMSFPVNRDGVFSIFSSGTTLTIRAFIEVREYGNIEAAAALGLMILLTITVLNLSGKLVGFLFSE